jgi:hypothetical protein
MIRLTAALGILALYGCGVESSPAHLLPPCSEKWNQLVEETLPTGDADGHGPDVGSMEWRSVVEFKLGIRDDPAVPALESEDWCLYMNEKILIKE